VDLIDFFHDLSLLKDGNSINFQKASCTLDGCVKVYSSRVDSVSNETNKLLNGLTSAEENGFFFSFFLKSWFFVLYVLTIHSYSRKIKIKRK